MPTQALGGRNADGLLPLLRFLVRHAANPRHSALCCGLAHRVLDVYTSAVGQSPAVDGRLRALLDVVTEELAVRGWCYCYEIECLSSHIKKKMILHCTACRVPSCVHDVPQVCSALMQIQGCLEPMLAASLGALAL
jgi:hypothetical protein